MRKLWLILITTALCGSLHAQCSRDIPPQVENVLQAHPDWKIVDISDLLSDDQKLWLEHRKDLCPGLARGHFIDLQADSYAVAVLQGRGAAQKEALIFVAPDQGPKGYRVINDWYGIPSGPQVVWTIPPGPTREWDAPAGKTFIVRTDSFAYEKIEAGAMQYFFVGAKLHYVTISN